MHDEKELNWEVVAAIEAYRPDSDDCDLPEAATVLAGASSARVARFRQSVERVDRAIFGAVHEVPVPEGLAARILASLPTASLPAGSLVGEAIDANLNAASDDLTARPTGASANVLLAPRSHRSRRLVWASSVGVALAASLLIVVTLWTSRESVDATELQAQAEMLYENDDHHASLSSVSSSVILPVAGNTVLGSRTVTFLGRAGEAYELSGRRRIRGTLYVVPLRSFLGPRLAELPTAPQPQGTRGMTVAAWTDGTNVYVMVVQGDQDAFRSFFSQKLA